MDLSAPRKFLPKRELHPPEILATIVASPIEPRFAYAECRTARVGAACPMQLVTELVDGSDRRTLVDGLAAIRALAFSPSGDAVAASEGDVSAPRLVVHRIDGSGSRDMGDEAPAFELAYGARSGTLFSPDGAEARARAVWILGEAVIHSALPHREARGSGAMRYLRARGARAARIDARGRLPIVSTAAKIPADSIEPLEPLARVAELVERADVVPLAVHRVYRRVAALIGRLGAPTLDAQSPADLLERIDASLVDGSWRRYHHEAARAICTLLEQDPHALDSRLPIHDDVADLYGHAAGRTILDALRVGRALSTVRSGGPVAAPMSEAAMAETVRDLGRGTAAMFGLYAAMLEQRQLPRWLAQRLADIWLGREILLARIFSSVGLLELPDELRRLVGLDQSPELLAAPEDDEPEGIAEAEAVAAAREEDAAGGARVPMSELRNRLGL